MPNDNGETIPEEITPEEEIEEVEVVESYDIRWTKGLNSLSASNADIEQAKGQSTASSTQMEQARDSLNVAEEAMESAQMSVNSSLDFGLAATEGLMELLRERKLFLQTMKDAMSV